MPLEQAVGDRIGPVLKFVGNGRAALATGAEQRREQARFQVAILATIRERHPIDLGQASDFDRVGNIGQRIGNPRRDIGIRRKKGEGHPGGDWRMNPHTNVD